VVVGLENITEIIACSSEEEPYYRCDLCPSKGQANMMFNHLLGKDHKKNVLKVLKPNIIDDNPRVICKELEEFRQTDWNLITSIKSDELYPWESGKAPWSVERGGTGEVPDGASRKDLFYAGERRGRGGSSTHHDSKSGILPADIEAYAAGFSRIKFKDTADVRKGYDLAMEVVRTLSEKQASPGDPGLLQLIAESTQTNLKTLKALGHRGDKAEVPDQASLWEIEQEKRKIKEEKSDRGYDRYDSTRRGQSPARQQSSEGSSGQGGFGYRAGESSRGGFGGGDRVRDDRIRERGSGYDRGGHDRDRSSSGRSSSGYDRSPEDSRKRKSYY